MASKSEKDCADSEERHRARFAAFGVAVTITTVRLAMRGHGDLVEIILIECGHLARNNPTATAFNTSLEHWPRFNHRCLGCALAYRRCSVG